MAVRVQDPHSTGAGRTTYHGTEPREYATSMRPHRPVYVCRPETGMNSLSLELCVVMYDVVHRTNTCRYMMLAGFPRIPKGEGLSAFRASTK